ncbi:unnamed protein product [Prorocentrum cordatum]|uniref:Cation efflux protein transmembrane domain-containing protein n=1 Tax=Prorocentrum cordatum TaxID=2364126 RepID=A0ABN9XGR6_9DINO|nr:unnamed protein product [Polarella glacialis]
MHGCARFLLQAHGSARGSCGGPPPGSMAAAGARLASAAPAASAGGLAGRLRRFCGAHVGIGRRRPAPRCAPAPAACPPGPPSPSSGSGAGLCGWRPRRRWGSSAEDAEPWASSPEAAARVALFRRSLRSPEDIFIRGSRARKMYGLTREDMQIIRELSIWKENPYEKSGPPFRQYPMKSVVELALRIHGEAALVRHYYNRYLLVHVMDSEVSGSLYHGSCKDGPGSEAEEAPAQVAEKDPAAGLRPSTGEQPPGTGPQYWYKRYWYNAPSSTSIEGRQSIVQGLKTNSSICLIKGAVWFSTGSHALFADWMHSIADVANYSYRLIELNRSSRQSDLFHPYGYAPLRYITADRSFVFLGFVGGLWPLGLGLAELLQASRGGASFPLGDALVAPAVVFCASALFEGAAVRAAYREILSQADLEKVGVGRGNLDRVLQYLREARRTSCRAGRPTSWPRSSWRLW